MSKKFKPIVFIDNKHEVASDKLSGKDFDIKGLVSSDKGNALDTDGGLYYSRCACMSYRYAVIGTEPYPLRAKDKYKTTFKPLKIKRYDVVYDRSYHEEIGIEHKLMQASVRSVTGYLNLPPQHEEIGIDHKLMGASVKTVTGYLNMPEQHEEISIRHQIVSAKVTTTIVERREKDKYRVTFKPLLIKRRNV